MPTSKQSSSKPAKTTDKRPSPCAQYKKRIPELESLAVKLQIERDEMKRELEIARSLAESNSKINQGLHNKLTHKNNMMDTLLRIMDRVTS